MCLNVNQKVIIKIILMEIILKQSIDIKQSTRQGKKFMAQFINKETNKTNTTHFGADGYTDYIQLNQMGSKSQPEEHKERYLSRHSKNENWSDITTAGFWSRWLLWNLPTINESIKHIENKFNQNNQ